jgi:hypothetical protein
MQLLRANGDMHHFAATRIGRRPDWLFYLDTARILFTFRSEGFTVGRLSFENY